MIDDVTFLLKIRDTPRDTATRLVYADWLEERYDPRAELIRIEEEMRLLPVFSDRYWELKPKRNALRLQAESGWLDIMGYGNVCQPLFRHGCRIDESDIFEDDDIQVRLNHWPSGLGLELELHLFKPLPKERLPAFLLDHVDQADSSYGMFVPPET